MKLKISRILHAGYIFECGNTKIAFDPIFENPFSRNCYAYPGVKFNVDQIKSLKLDAIFISHFHDDHCSLESLNLLDRTTPIFIYCIYPEIFDLIRELGFTNVQSLVVGVPINMGALEVIPRLALDSDVDSLFQIRAAGLNVLNVVDSWIDPQTINELARFVPWDMVLWPFQTMRELEVLAPSRAGNLPVELPKEWLEQLKILNPRYVVPSSCQFVQEHWSWYNQAFFPISYSHFENEVKNILPNSKVIKLNPSVSVMLGKNSLEMAPPLPWIEPLGEQNVDYEFAKNLTPPTTAEISKHFLPLNSEQTKVVFEFCRTGIIDKYRSLPSPADPFFKKPRVWRLSVFDHNGEVTNFFYNLANADISLTDKNVVPISWSTEVPMAKLYAALKQGETLTSMYIRINDVGFDPDVENEISAADIFDDPLVRCLFHGVFGAYQRAQLNRLKNSES